MSPKRKPAEAIVSTTGEVIELSPEAVMLQRQTVPEPLRRAHHQPKPEPVHRKVEPFQKGKKPKNVSLAPFEKWDKVSGRVKDRDAEKAAADREVVQATPERLRQADPEMVRTGKGVHIQNITSAPLDVLKQRGKLAKEVDGKVDLVANDLLFRAGDRFRECWRAAGLTGISAMDMSRIGSGEGNAAWSMPTSEHAAHNRSLVREAIRNLGDYLAGYVVAIVAEERSLEDVGRQFTGRADRNFAIAHAIEVLRAGLTSLAWHWGYVRR